MKKTLLLGILTGALSFQGCAMSEAMAQSYKDNMKQNSINEKNVSMNRDSAKNRLVSEKTRELVSMYGGKRGYLIAQKALTDENIEYNFDSQNFYAFIDPKVIEKYINETRGLEDDINDRETIIIIKK